jgi:chorismate mutase/prephenate dehydratase
MYSAAVCSSLCSKLYDVPIIQEDINDHKYNFTRFLILGQNSEKASGKDRTLAVFTVDHRKPGALCDTLKAFKDHDINLTQINTRPYPKELKPWHYKFIVEFEGHFEDENVSVVLKEVEKYCLDIKVLGSYLDQKPE